MSLQIPEVFEQRTIANMALLITQKRAVLVDDDMLAALLDELEASPDDGADRPDNPA